MKKPGIVIAGLFALSTILLAQQAQKTPLSLKASIPLPGVKGDFDHFAADVQGNRLFLAAEDHKSVEVFDLKTGKPLNSITGFDTPHAILYVPKNNTLLVTDSGVDGGTVGYIRVVSGTTYKITNSLKVLAAADSAGYDAQTHLWYADTGGTEAGQKSTVISVINSETPKVVGEIKVDSGRVEAIQFEQNGPHMYANLRTIGKVGVFDRKTNKLLTTWDVAPAKDNVSMALDEVHHRLFVVCRAPAALVVFDTQTGKQVATLPIAGLVDDMQYDPATRQIYVSAGDGFEFVFEQKDPDHYVQLAKVPTGFRAKISTFVPELKQLYVAVSATPKTPAKLLVFNVK